LLLRHDTQIGPARPIKGGSEAQARSLNEEPSASRSEKCQHKGYRKNMGKEKINNLKVFRLFRVYVIINPPSPAECRATRETLSGKGSFHER
jgi:hypothetical protein